MKHVKSVLTIAVLITLVTGAAQAIPQTYSSPAKNFSIDFPNDWEIKSHHNGTAVIGAGPLKDQNDLFRENVSVVTNDLKSPATSRQFYEANLYAMKQAIPGLQITDSEDVNIDGTPAVRVITDHQLGTFQAKALAYFFTRNGTGYVVTCTALREDFDKNRAGFETIVKTFKFK